MNSLFISSFYDDFVYNRVLARVSLFYEGRLLSLEMYLLVATDIS